MLGLFGSPAAVGPLAAADEDDEEEEGEVGRAGRNSSADWEIALEFATMKKEQKAHERREVEEAEEIARSVIRIAENQARLEAARTAAVQAQADADAAESSADTDPDPDPDPDADADVDVDEVPYTTLQSSPPPLSPTPPRPPPSGPSAPVHENGPTKRDGEDLQALEVAQLLQRLQSARTLLAKVQGTISQAHATAPVAEITPNMHETQSLLVAYEEEEEEEEDGLDEAAAEDDEDEDATEDLDSVAQHGRARLQKVAEPMGIACTGLLAEWPTAGTQVVVAALETLEALSSASTRMAETVVLHSGLHRLFTCMAVRFDDADIVLAALKVLRILSAVPSLKSEILDLNAMHYVFAALRQFEQDASIPQAVENVLALLMRPVHEAEPDSNRINGCANLLEQLAQDHGFSSDEASSASDISSEQSQLPKEDEEEEEHDGVRKDAPQEFMSSSGLGIAVVVHGGRSERASDLETISDLSTSQLDDGESNAIAGGDENNVQPPGVVNNCATKRNTRTRTRPPLTSVRFADHYILLRKLNEGKYSEVFEARHAKPSDVDTAEDASNGTSNDEAGSNRNKHTKSSRRANSVPTIPLGAVHKAAAAAAATATATATATEGGEAGNGKTRGSFRWANGFRRESWAALTSLMDRKQDHVAVKCITRSHEQMTEKHREAVASEVILLRRLRHPYIVHLLDFFYENNTYMIVTPLMRGADVLSLLRKKGPYKMSNLQVAAYRLLSAVTYLHSKSIVHRDIKPANLFLESASNTASVCLGDFGFARLVDPDPESEHLRPTMTVGTEGFMAPELVQGQPYGTAADIWSVGVTLWQMAEGLDTAVPIPGTAIPEHAETAAAKATASSEDDSSHRGPSPGHANDFVDDQNESANLTAGLSWSTSPSPQLLQQHDDQEQEHTQEQEQGLDHVHSVGGRRGGGGGDAVPKRTSRTERALLSLRRSSRKDAAGRAGVADIISLTLREDPRERATAIELLSHPWFLNVAV